MSTWSALIIVKETAMEGLENFQAPDMVQACQVAMGYAASVGGRVVRVESCDFGAFEFMR